MAKLPVCLVGCGGMGNRHVAGFVALERSGLSNVELVAVCDIREDNAKRAADDAERLLGRRPTIHTSIDAALADPAIEAFDIVTEAWTHIAVAMPILAAGKHVLCEKPLALTVKSCRLLIDAAKRSGAVLATAENYRRDPPSRLARAIIDAGLLGHVHLMHQFLVGGSDRIIITPWRHMKDKGSIGLDMGCHLTDIMQFYLGEIESVHGTGLIAEPTRYRREVPEKDLPSYWARLREMPESVEATGEDSMIATYKMKSGVLAEITYIPSGPGRRWVQRTVHGRKGSLEAPRDRTGDKVILHRESGSISGDELLAELPDFHLDELTSRLFDDKVAYTLDFNDSDAALIAIEIHDFANAVLNGGRPEVDGHLGLTAVAAVLAVYESGVAGRPVTMDEILSGKVSAYQDSIDAGIAQAAKVA
ncbi:Gfo/Idh/MocA family oxidoreductase [uncultured Nitratireductor sp.]|uniref:Gfo/Idh/MocA family protein n=1 Tax=uncultured Nitratireductor sp. TaxID=520953 RepID=UPI0025EC2632|nr:Gfo/Idh/MocA family oxidoreductase [uncultured Nitratireductor sp.]